MDIYNIRYAKIHFILTFTEETVMPKDKVSGFRGGIGEMMLRSGCVRKRECEKCDFLEECPVQKIMYAKCKITPKSVTEGESMGYIFECEDKTEYYQEGDNLELTLVLFGSNILYFRQYVQALAMLGVEGIGKNQSHFTISAILNGHREPITEGTSIFMERYLIETLKDYVEYRRKRIGSPEFLRIDFVSPTAVKYQGELLESFDLDAIYRSILRRIYMLDCFEGIAFEEELKFVELPYTMAKQEVYAEKVRRFSNHKQQKMVLTGITGHVHLERKESGQDTERFLNVLLAGEILHLGKNTSFGFGKYRIAAEEKME